MGLGGLVASNTPKSSTATEPIEADAVVELYDIIAIPHEEASEPCDANMIALSFRKALTVNDFTKDSGLVKSSLSIAPRPSVRPRRK